MPKRTDRDGYFEVRRNVRADAGVRSIGDIAYLRDERVRSLAKRVGTEVHGWLERYPLSSRNRVDAMMLTCSAMCVDIGFEAAVASAKLTLLMFAIDDVVDGTSFVPEDDQADALLVTCGEIATTRGRVDVDARLQSIPTPLDAGLEELWRGSVGAFQAYCRHLAKLPGADAYYDHFAKKFVAMTEGMRVELRARRHFIETGEVPGFSDYYRNGQRSVGAPAVFGSTLLASNPVLAPEAWRAAMPLVDEYLWTAGGCIRLTNDVRSHARELEIEQRPNSVAIKMLTEGLDEKAAEVAVIRLADGDLAALEHQAARMPAPLRDWCESVRRFASVIRDWYMLRELHEQTDVPPVEVTEQ